MTGKAGLMPGKRLYRKATTAASAAAEPQPWPFGPHVAGSILHTHERGKAETGYRNALGSGRITSLFVLEFSIIIATG